MMQKHNIVRSIAGGVAAVLLLTVLAACASQPAATAAPQLSGKSGPESGSQAPAYDNSPAAPAYNNNDAGAAGQTGASTGSSTATISYSKDILPLFQASCVNCHGGERTSRALDLKTYDSLMAGSQNGAVITPGDAANSMLVNSIMNGKMPKRGAKWTPEQIQLLVDWVNAGAKNN